MTGFDPLACLGCGSVDSTLSTDQTMRSVLRASASRRADHSITSPPPRARSQERWKNDVNNKHDNNDDDDRRSNNTSSTTASSSVESSIPRPEMHRRAMSDPFDTQEDDDSNEPVDEDWKQQPFLPTFPRFPVSATRNRNCWSVPLVDIFSVRSKMYMENGKLKEKSGPYLMQARGCDLLLNNKHSSSQMEDDTMVNGSAIEDKLHMILEGRLRSEPTLAVNFKFPWGFMILYWQVPERLAPYMTDQTIPIDMASLSVPEQTLAKWLMGDNEYKNQRLKLIPYVAEGPWVVRKMVTGTPAIIGKKLPVTHTLHTGESPHSTSNNHGGSAPLMLTTLDIGSGSATAKRIVGVCRRYMSALTVDIGFVIQGESEDELPEQMLGSIRIHGPDPLRAVYLS